MRELPGKLTVEELADLFEGRTRFVQRLAEVDDPLRAARTLVHTLPDEEKREVLDAHPAIGARNLSERSAVEQGSDDDPEILDELARLNGDYERTFGFRFVVFVDGRPKSELLPVLRARLGRTREEELETALDELVAIAEDRWRKG